MGWGQFQEEARPEVGGSQGARGTLQGLVWLEAREGGAVGEGRGAGPGPAACWGSQGRLGF